MQSIFHANGIQRSVQSNDWHAEIMAGGYGAVIFDCDGTLVHSGEAHFQSFKKAAQAQGQDMQRDWYDARTGLDRRSLLAAFSAECAHDFDIDLALKQSIQSFIDGPSSVTPIDETVALVRALHPSHPMAVATNAELKVAQTSLRATGLLRFFDHILSISNGVAPKPAPDIFLLATDRLGFGAAKTLVFEDSPQGVSAALAAGLDVFQLTEV